MIAAAAVCSVCAIYAAARNIYYSERRQVRAALAEVEGISIISIDAFHDVTEEIGGISISVDDHPHSRIRLGNLSSYDDTGRFFLRRIGKWRFVVFGRRNCGAYKAATGEPVESDYYGYHIDLGSGSPYNELIPFESATLQEVVRHYQGFVELLDSWPRESDPGQITLNDGSTQYYYVVEDPLLPN